MICVICSIIGKVACGARNEVLVLSSNRFAGAYVRSPATNGLKSA